MRNEVWQHNGAQSDCLWYGRPFAGSFQVQGINRHPSVQGSQPEVIRRRAFHFLCRTPDALRGHVRARVEAKRSANTDKPAQQESGLATCTNGFLTKTQRLAHETGTRKKNSPGKQHSQQVGVMACPIARRFA